MKRIHYIITGIIIFMVTLSVSLTSCSDILDEQPRTFFEPGFFQTEMGIRNGLTALYFHTRNVYGGYFHAFTQSGTDESTYAQSADNNQHAADLSLSAAGGNLFGGGITPSSCRSGIVWDVYPYINTANGIIENGEAAEMNPALLAEAYFFRGWDFFMLAQTFGGVPLDLGSGELKFNAKPSRVSVRNTVPEVYTKAIFPDLKKAVDNLPLEPRVQGAVAKTVARFFLAKAYLTYGWWLENPGNIPTYPPADRVDPDGHNAAWYYQEAYNIAKAAIDNPGPFGLMPTFYEAHLYSNDRNKEVLLYSDHNDDTQFGGYQLNDGSVGAPYNAANWLVTWNYTEIQVAAVAGQPAPVQREAVQALGRPWTRTAPTIEALRDIFNDKTNDSRYDGTFVTTYFGNWHKVPATSGVQEVIAANGMAVPQRGAIVKFLHYQPAPGTITYPEGSPGQGNSGVGAGEMAGESAYVIGLEDINRRRYPGQWKNGPQRYDHDSNISLGLPNGTSPRPYNIAKFSELYLIAAEAAVKAGNNSAAVEMINVVRTRAGKWAFKLSENTAYVADFSANMVAATPATITIDYILDERSRELYGESLRWYDLARTQKWIERSQKYTIGGGWDAVRNDYNLVNQVEITRAIETKHYLRPIPQGQMDSLEGTDEEKRAFQNPGY